MTNGQIFFVRVGAVLGALGVIFGAFGAHGLEGRLSPEMMETFEVGVRYHFYHTLALFAVALSFPALWSVGLTRVACWAWLLGIVLFSGSLYVLALTELKWFGAITPVGGAALIAGWVLIAVAAYRVPSESP